jgi:DNA-binding SARP family transcriptional activator
MFHRARAALDQLGSNMGHGLIVRRDGNYAWNVDTPCTLDIDDFESLCKRGASTSSAEERLEACLGALRLYGGDFLPKMSAESWVVPISAYYHNMYIDTACIALEILSSLDRHSDIVELCARATEIDEFNETFYEYMLKSLIALGKRQEAVEVYEKMSGTLFEHFGVMPSEGLRELYREAVKTVNSHEISFGIVRDQLREGADRGGALLCEYDFFKIIYRAEARAVARNGSAVHIGLMSVCGENGAELPKRSLTRVMDNLGELIRTSLRKGDIASRCSVSQYIIMLPQSNYENSCMVMERIVKAFCRQYPHSPAELKYAVQPLEPNA